MDAKVIGVIAAVSVLIIVGSGIGIYSAQKNNDSNDPLENDLKLLDSEDSIKRGLKIEIIDINNTTIVTKTVTVSSASLMVDYSQNSRTEDKDYHTYSYKYNFSPSNFKSTYGFDYTSASNIAGISVTNTGNAYTINGTYTKSESSYYYYYTTYKTFNFSNLTIKWTPGTSSSYDFNSNGYWKIGSVDGSISDKNDNNTVNETIYRTLNNTVSTKKVTTTSSSDSCLKECFFEKHIGKYTDTMKLATTSGNILSYNNVKVYDYKIENKSSTSYSYSEYYVYNDYIVHSSTSNGQNQKTVKISMS